SQGTVGSAGGAGERAVAVVAFGLQDCRDAPIPGIGRCISPAVGEVAAGDHAEVACVAVGGVAVGSIKAGRRIGGLRGLGAGAALPFCVGSPGIRRRPLTSTMVRLAPRPRSDTVASPVAPLETPAPY